MEAKRTPDRRFGGLPDFDFDPNYIDSLPGYEKLRMHYLDEGPGSATQTFLCLHGQPTWSYLYRKMIPVFVASGGRVIAPDLFGFGRSDKPVEEATYNFHFHRNSLLRLIETLELENITLVCQDWGGLLGLTLPMEMPDRFSRLIVMNTAIATGQSAGEGFEQWRAYNRSQPDLDIAALMQRSVGGLSDAEAQAYAAPFPDLSYKAGVRQFPELVMTRPDMPGVQTSIRALRFWQDEWAGDSFMAIGLQDPVLGPAIMKKLHSVIRDCPEPLELPEAGHFVQESGVEVATQALAYFASI